MSNNSLGMGGSECNPPISLWQTELSLKQFAKWMEQANYMKINKWKKVRVTELMGNRHQSIIQGQNS